MNSLRSYKFLVIPVLQQVGEDGTVVAEAQREQPDAVFGVDGLRRYAEGFEEALAQHLNAARAATTDGAVPEGRISASR